MRRVQAGPARAAGITSKEDNLFVVLCASGFENPERVRSALMFASLAAVSGHRTVLYCIQGAVDVMVRGTLESQEKPEAPLPTISQRLREALEAGVEVLCCSQTVANRGLGQEDFIEGVKISGAMNLIYLGDRAKGMLSF